MDRMRDVTNEARNAYTEVKNAANAADGAYRETMEQVDDARRKSDRTGSRERDVDRGP